MKVCDYCGGHNPEVALVCSQCGGTEFKTPVTETSLPEVVAAQEPFDIRSVLTDPAHAFQAFVVISVTTYLIWVGLPWLDSDFISDEAWAARGYSGAGAVLITPKSIFWLNVLLQIPLSIGLYCFSTTARSIWITFTVFYLGFDLLDGVNCGSAVDGFLWNASRLADGAILGLAYFSPLKERFK